MDNYTKEGKQSLRLQTEVCDRRTVTDLSADFTLPDYQPEIKRLLRVRATVSPPDKYIGAGNADFSGSIDYAILYAGNDGALYCATESGEYQFTLPIEVASDIDLNEGLVCDTEILPETVTGRVIAPRKFSVKCRLRSHVRLYGTRCIEETVNGADPSTLQRLCGNIESARVFVGTGDPLQLGDEILCDAQSGDIRVISAEGQVFVNEAVAGSGVVNCRGEICLKLLCAQEGTQSAPTALLRRIPFSQAVVTEGAEVNCDACAFGVCSQLQITVEEGRILCEVALLLRTRAQRNEALSFTRDLYSTAAECESTYTEALLPRAIKCINGNFSLNTALPLEEVGIRSGMSVADVALSPTVTSLESDHGKYVLIGRCRVSTVLCDAEDAVAQEFEVPFRYETDGGDETVTDFDATVDPISCRARIDGERIGLDAELAVSLSLRGESRCRMLTEAQFSEPLAPKGAVYTVCYPAKEDTLWSVAKRYHRAVSTVSEMNHLAGSPAADAVESLDGVTYLLV
ncbi:MAG: hypothetical protein IKJ35_09055 [Clostridia bacterium]|nr:hypothetical protein [Clostridia bacterium]